MTRKYLFLTACILLTLCPSTAFGAGNFYLSINGGVAFLNDSDLSVTGVASGDLKFKTGFGVGGAVGYDLNTIPIRFEGEVTYRKNDIDNLIIASNAFPDVSGDFTAWSFMANWYWDFLEEILGDSSLSAYLLAGIGAANIEVNNLSVRGQTLIGSSDDTTFAAQFGAGIGYAVSSNVTVDLSYRFFFVDDFEVKDISRGTVELEYPSHNIFLGIRFAFK